MYINISEHVINIQKAGNIITHCILLSLRYISTEQIHITPLNLLIMTIQIHVNRILIIYLHIF